MASTADPAALEQTLQEERTWSAAGDHIARSKATEDLIRQKEAQLRSVLSANYHHMKSVEAELAALQTQVRLTSGPKRSALEMMRQKIERQNDRVRAVKAKRDSAAGALAAAQAVLDEEEAAKHKLCGELNLLVQQSATEEMQKLDELNAKLLAMAIPDKGAPAAAAGGAPTPAGPRPVAESSPVEGAAASPPAASPTTPDAAQPTSPSGAASAATAAAPPPASSPSAEDRAATERAQAAHVKLPAAARRSAADPTKGREAKPRRAKPAAPSAAAPRPIPADPNAPFEGFE